MKKLALIGLLASQLALPTWAQISLPSNGSQKAEVAQYVGLTKIKITYSSPNVMAPDGTDRTDKIWGELVPYGFNDWGFGTSKAAPWRAGADENTTFETSHEIVVEGKTLPAGKYGFFVATQKDKPWTVIFSKTSTAWGSFYYNADNDVLRVEVMPQASEQHQWLTYEFTERKPTETTLTLFWEKVKLPIEITVPKTSQYYIENLRKELHGAQGLASENWATAAAYCAQNKLNLEEALSWADMAINAPFVGRRNFQTLSTKAQVLAALGKMTEHDALMKEAIAHPTATAMDIHLYGRTLLGAGRKQEALAIFKMNAERNKTEWVVNVGLLRGYSAAGEYKKALAVAEEAIKKAPDEANKRNIANMIEKLKRGKDVN